MARKNKRIEQAIPKLRAQFVKYWPPTNRDGEFYIARLIEQDGEYLDLKLPNGTKITTHIANIGGV